MFGGHAPLPATDVCRRDFVLILRYLRKWTAAKIHVPVFTLFQRLSSHGRLSPAQGKKELKKRFSQKSEKALPVNEPKEARKPMGKMSKRARSRPSTLLFFS